MIDVNSDGKMIMLVQLLKIVIFMDASSFLNHNSAMDLLSLQMIIKKYCTIKPDKKVLHT